MNAECGVDLTEAFAENERAERFKLLASQCLARLKGYRVAALELANLMAGTKFEVW